ncbi:Ras-related protein Rab-6A [Nematocida homosporus]|uniref:Ras-related protein Rab-6A n=1 Tax=Nematocida homosporus TaxID=1912981 RepID=UPI00222011C7|nr:Ras-related protein Rab-6A [Nematocida homosporus]KAI5186863.1 Ras-related protein Rab-6A [Nematocida homosporus]
MAKQTHQEVLPKYKIVFLGETAVGKTTMITKYVFSTETRDYHPTIGVDFFAQKTEIGGKPVNLQLWDTAGQERFRSLIPNYTRDSFMAVVLFDLTKRETFDRVDVWIKDFVMKNNDGQLRILLVGNKKDLAEQIPVAERPVSLEEAQEKAKVFGAKYIETSSLTQDGIEAFAQAIVEAVENSAVPEQKIPVFSIEVEQPRGCFCL